jgi:hypothetical protein
LINCCVFSLIISMISVVRLLYSIYLEGARASVGIYLVWFVLGIVFSYSFYILAVSSIPQWGDLVKSAFDCYLPALAERLGFELPKTDAA